MSNEITTILQSLAPQHKVPGKAQGVPGLGVPGQARVASQPTVIEKPTASNGDRVTLSDAARLMQLAETKQARSSALRLESSDVGMTTARTDSSVKSAASHLTAPGNAQRPSPAMANMMEAFLTTSDMEGFNASSDLNADGVINFQDLAALRDIETGAGAVVPETPKALFNNMTEAFLSSEGSEGFDAASDLNDDGMINFQDLAILRSKMDNSDATNEPLASSD